MNNAIALALLLPLSAIAAENPAPPKEQPKRGGPMLDEKYADKLDEHLQLKAEQKVKIKAAIEKAKPELDKLHKELEAVHERMRKAMGELNENIRATLDIEQKERFDEMRAHMRRRFRADLKPRPDGSSAGRFHEERAGGRGGEGEGPDNE